MGEWPAAPGPLPFVFTATGSGYFRIWIVNLLLTIVTIGLYSPWAKVRRLRYFYGNTLVDGSPFEFHGRPIALLKGRLIAIVLFAAYSQSIKVSVTLWVVTVVILFILMPWLMWKSFRFRLANSSYRGIHFAFDGTLGQAYSVFVPLFIAVVGPTLGFTFLQAYVGSEDVGKLGSVLILFNVLAFIAAWFIPWFYFRLRAYQHRHARLGTTSFTFDARVSGAYGILFKGIAIGIGLVVVAAIVGGVVAVSAGLFHIKGLASNRGALVIIGVLIVAFYLWMVSGFAMTRAMIQNFVWNHSALGAANFYSNVGILRLWWIEFGNLVLCLVTLGFYWPFALVRSMRYRIEAVAWDGRPDDLVAAADAARIGATGEETADMFGLDFAL
jgi:uncharacterized membrane protein YjgN (DUF898 family)